MDNSIVIGAIVTGILVWLGGQFDNHLWRLICIYVTMYGVLPQLDLYASQHWILRGFLALIVSAAILYIPHLRPKQKRGGCVVITGCDSGMGQATVVYLAQTNNNNNNNNNNKNAKGRYDKIFAACFNAKAAQTQLEEIISDKKVLEQIQVIALDATKDESVKQAAKTVETFLKQSSSYLAGVICYHGIAYNGPLAYMPLQLFQTQMEVNFLGNVRMVQAFLPLLRAMDVPQASNSRRMVFTGTGGGPCSPCPPLLTAYMCSKFAGEAMAQSLKQELYMTQGNGPKIEVSVRNFLCLVTIHDFYWTNTDS